MSNIFGARENFKCFSFYSLLPKFAMIYYFSVLQELLFYENTFHLVYQRYDLTFEYLDLF